MAPDIPAVHRLFDYSVPARFADQVRLGARVRIDLHGRRVGAYVVEDDVVAPPGVVVRSLAATSGQGPPPELLPVARWAAWRWAGPLVSFLGTASPPRNVPFPAGSERPDNTLTPPAPSATWGSVPPLAMVPSPGGGAVDLVEAALAGPLAGSGDGGDRSSVIRLAPALDQFLVVQELASRLGAESLLVLAPTLGRAQHVARRLRRLGVAVAQLPDDWAAARAGGSVVVGTRSGAWAPLSRIRAVVVLDAHEEAYREERAPTWSAIEVVRERARRDRAPVLLLTPCPPLVLEDTSRLVTTERALERSGWAPVEVVDRTGDDPRSGLFSESLVRALHRTLDRPEGRVICILHRTGRVRLLACAECGNLARCTRCQGAVERPEKDGPLVCGRCGEVRPAVCATCDARRLKSLRIGVSRATEELSALTGVAAVEVSGSGRNPGGSGHHPGEGESTGDERLVVGTEAALYRRSRADLVAFLDVDQHLLAPRFAAAEETLASLARASRLVGGRRAGGLVLVQTRWPDHVALAAAVHGDPGLVAEGERAVRRSLAFPPYGALATVKGAGAEGFSLGLAGCPGVSCSPLDGETWLVRAATHEELCGALATVERPPGRLRVAVDPGNV